MADVLDLLESPGQSVIITRGTDEQNRDELFERACRLYPHAKVEMDDEGNIIVTPGNSEDSGYRSGAAFAQLYQWARKDGTGRAFDCSTNFNLPSGAKRQPDASWVPRETLNREGEATRTATKTRHVPTYLIEVTSPSDILHKQQEKCGKWIESGVEEAVLLHPKTKTAYVFVRSAAGSPHAMQELPDALVVPSSVLSGFVIDCGPIWEDL